MNMPAICAGSALLACLLSPTANAQSMCAIERAEAHTQSREADGLDGSVSPDLLAEFEAQCSDQAPVNEPIHTGALRGQNLFDQPRINILYTLLMPQGNTGAGVPIPAGPHVSASDGRIALTRVCEDSESDTLCRNHTTVMFDLAGGTAIACQRIFMPGDPPQVWWTFNQAEIYLDSDGRWCPADPAEIPPEALRYWLGEIPTTRGK